MKFKDFWGFEQEFDQLTKYLDLTKSALDDYQKQFFDWVNKESKVLSDEEKDDFQMFYEDDYNEVTHDFPRLLYSSFVVTWYSFVEHQLIEICRKSNLRLSISVDDNERHGEGINRAYNFLLRGRNYRIHDKHWQELKRIGKVRNQIAHNNGKIIISDDVGSLDSQKNIKAKTSAGSDVFLLIDGDFYKYLESHNIIETGEIFYISPDYKFCQHLIDFGKTLLNKVDVDLSLLTAKDLEKRIQDSGGRKPLPDDWLLNTDH